METRIELLDKLESILNQDKDINLILKEIEPVQSVFEDSIEKEINNYLEQFVAEGGEPDNFVAPKLEDQEKFNTLIFNAKARKERKEQEIKRAHEENLKTKEDLVAKLRDIIKNEENISKAFNRMDAIRDKWKEVGEVSSHHYRDLQNEYSKALEEFFYHINIYKELKDNDFKKNLQLREELVLKMKALVDKNSIKEIRNLSGAYLSEWDEIGPVNRENWETIRESFRAATKEVHDKIKKHFTAIKEQRQENLLKKQELLTKATEITNVEIDNLKLWKKKTEEVLEIQKQWKSIGFATKKENDKIWEDFRGICNQFFEKKGTFFGGEKEKWNANKELKEKLVKKAEKIKESTDWKETSFQMIKLQKEWKKVGSAGQKAEQSLWTKFRATCDFFFNAKKEYFDTLDDRLAENLKKKEAFISILEKAEIEKEKGVEQIKKFIAEWDTLGMVPKSSIKSVNEKYRKAIDSLYNKLGLDKNAIENQKFIDKVENIKQNDNAEKLLQDELRFINENIDKLNKEVLQYENNLSFFGFSKGATADKMKQEVQSKIDAVQAKTKGWTQKRKEISKVVRELKKQKENA